MKQVSATYQYELTEDELRMLCDALHVVIEDSKRLYDSTKKQLELEKLTNKEALDKTKSMLAMKERLTSLIDLYNGLGNPVAKLMSLSL